MWGAICKKVTLFFDEKVFKSFGTFKSFDRYSVHSNVRTHVRYTHVYLGTSSGTAGAITF